MNDRLKARSDADRELAEYVTAHVGWHVSPWQIEACRQAGMIQEADHRYPGGGSSEANYSPVARQQAVEVARLSKKYRKHDELARVVFMRGLYVRPNALSAAFARPFDKMLGLIGPLSSEKDKDRLGRFVLKIARYMLTTLHGKWMKSRLNGDRYGIPDLLYTVLHIYVTGQIPSDVGFELMLKGSGLIGLYQHRIGELGPIAPDDNYEGLKSFLKQATLTAMRDRVSVATLAELEEAREMTRLVIPFFRDFAIAISKTSGQGRAFGLDLFGLIKLDELALANFVPMILFVMPWIKTEGGQTVVAAMRSRAVAYRGMAELTERVPEALMKRLVGGDASALSELDPELQERVRSVARELAATAPS
jgi:hypothetical protein